MRVLVLVVGVAWCGACVGGECGDVDVVVGVVGGVASGVYASCGA